VPRRSLVLCGGFLRHYDCKSTHTLARMPEFNGSVRWCAVLLPLSSLACVSLKHVLDSLGDLDFRTGPCLIGVAHSDALLSPERSPTTPWL
jgi:hypothetical protein